MSTQPKILFSVLICGTKFDNKTQKLDFMGMTNANWFANENEALGAAIKLFYQRHPGYSIGYSGVDDLTDLIAADPNQISKPEVRLWNEPAPTWNPNQPSSDDELRDPSPTSSPEDLTLTEICTLPPSGYYCTRGAGHPGPCAAHPSPPEMLF